jgi:hypothetical protein
MMRLTLVPRYLQEHFEEGAPRFASGAPVGEIA